jgi:multiple antibiotic resistance protein
MVEVLETLKFGLIAFTSIVAIMNPISTVAVFSSLTSEMGERERTTIIRSSMRVALSVLVFFAFTGQILFYILGLTVPAFKIAGGILLLSMAMGMIRAKKEVYTADELENIAIVPIAFPLTCGAGTITTVILLSSEAQGIVSQAMVYVAILLCIGISYVGLQQAQRILSVLGDHEIRVLVRLLAIFVLAIGVQFLINGIGEALPQILANLPESVR